MTSKPAKNYLLDPPRRLGDTVRSVLPGRLDRSRRQAIESRVIVVTGASSGVGRAAALALAARGATLVLIARGAEALHEVRAEIFAAGGSAEAITGDLASAEDSARLATEILALHGRVDVLVNNAGRSIRRSGADAADRFHDYERTIAINYFGAARLTMALLPSMLEARSGHIVNVATWGVAAGSMPLFTAYHASKAALAAFGRSLAAETRPQGVDVTTIGFPLVRTAMIAPTAKYASAPAISPERAAEWIIDAIRTRPVEVHPRYAHVLRAIGAFSPRAVDALVWRMGI
ncbi:SDR family NAD(P)-dependent oxidoreductase [Hoyosella sp. G463]|uniref:SDR family NAD(P)-dependent oxidoreductase n=1 Tax=Lolliginicoccus lacisalsi TaxID=2742202 RepID=A0A927PKU9_9ACTN|nr:SDR family NAD(P)-dependent oxidoreductase [Lolliginicoccus lacisalsi]MBD8505174.1 SDR family NAD(P)-dependent oxidoreductase [Lolliginicoccus lacisalsi]